MEKGLDRSAPRSKPVEFSSGARADQSDPFFVKHATEGQHDRVGANPVRSPGEILFRIRQEAADLWLWITRPAPLLEQSAPLARLPDPSAVAEALRGTSFAAEVERLAELILQHCFPLPGAAIETGPEIEWRRDYVHRITSGAAYFRRVPYLDLRRVGDHKIVWELNRHQHLVLLAQAFRLSGRTEFFREIVRQLESWFAQNPYMRGMNWASALEVAFRALSWLWVYHLAGERMETDFRRRFLAWLYRHALYLEHNLSVYFSPNTHLLGEAVALHALGVLFPAFPGARRWERLGGRVVREQMDRQVREDGSHFEQSSYYQVYALDLLLWHQVLAETSPAFRQKLCRMSEYLQALLGPAAAIPFIGDDDGGRLFHPYGSRDRFARATLATAAVLLRTNCRYQPEDLHEQAAWWLGEAALRHSGSGECAGVDSRLFPQAGMAVMRTGQLQVLVDAGPFGAGSAGHSHSDTLSMLVRHGDEEILIDPGTYTYVGDPAWRAWFRGSAAHNTVRVDAIDQARPDGPFRWQDTPRVEILRWETSPGCDYMDAVCAYAGFRHRRRVLLVKPDLVAVLDEVTGGPGEHLVEQFWHLGPSVLVLSPSCFRVGTKACLGVDAAGEVELTQGGRDGWRSRCLNHKESSPVVRVSRKTHLPARLGAILDLSGSQDPIGGEVRGEAELVVKGPPSGSIRFLEGNLPEFTRRSPAGR